MYCMCTYSLHTFGRFISGTVPLAAKMLCTWPWFSVRGAPGLSSNLWCSPRANAARLQGLAAALGVAVDGAIEINGSNNGLAPAWRWKFLKHSGFAEPRKAIWSLSVTVALLLPMKNRNGTCIIYHTFESYWQQQQQGYKYIGRCHHKLHEVERVIHIFLRAVERSKRYSLSLCWQYWNVNKKPQDNRFLLCLSWSNDILFTQWLCWSAFRCSTTGICMR